MAKPRSQTWNDATDVDGNLTVPEIEDAYLLPNDWDPSTDTNGGIGVAPLSPNGSSDSEEVTSYGWNEKLKQWIDAP